MSNAAILNVTVRENASYKRNIILQAQNNNDSFAGEQ